MTSCRVEGILYEEGDICKYEGELHKIIQIVKGAHGGYILKIKSIEDPKKSGMVAAPFEIEVMHEMAKILYGD